MEPYGVKPKLDVPSPRAQLLCTLNPETFKNQAGNKTKHGNGLLEGILKDSYMEAIAQYKREMAEYKFTKDATNL